ncbi:unnamed protein product [Paramecium octaurelia]|uniref:Cytochrome c domain-containing protein n=1 Tax=Paramecium octaurelia TaxID=43137 RepID=A0A8S1VIQ0_PAROT|nr:unnamed protein product [Paramecium octaurelia]
MSEDPNEKWKKILLNPYGKSKDDVQNEIRAMHKEQQMIDEAITREALLQTIKAKKTYRNLTNPNTNADKSKLVPVDGDLKQGAKVFMRACASCHSLEIFTGKPYAADFSFQESSGPSLAQIYNKPAASQRVYEEYTMALLDSKIYWNSYNLFMWAKDPQAMCKGTKCLQRGELLESAEERADLVKFLKGFAKATSDLYRRSFTKYHGYEWQNYREQGLVKAREVAHQRQGYEPEKK